MFTETRRRRSTGQQQGTKSGRGPAHQTFVNRYQSSCSLIRFTLGLICLCFRKDVQDGRLPFWKSKTRGRALREPLRPASVLPRLASPRLALPRSAPTRLAPPRLWDVRVLDAKNWETGRGIMVSGSNAVCQRRLGRSVVAMVGLRERRLNFLRSILIRRVSKKQTSKFPFLA